MPQSFLAPALALAGALLLPLAATAVPINAANGLPDSAPGATTGPKRPGLIPAPASSGSGSTDLSNRRGRAVPGLSETPSIDKGLAEAQPVRVP